MPNYRIAVYMPREERASYNQLVFATEAEAKTYGSDLLSRWLAPSSFEVEATDLPVSAVVQDGTMRLLDLKEERR